MTPTPFLDACSKTDIGLKRSKNEDVCAANIEDNFFLIADGMGGAAKGDLASRYFLSATENVFTAKPQTVQPELKERSYACVENPEEQIKEEQLEKYLNLAKDRVYCCFEEANSSIQKHIKKIPSHKGMGCTAELLTLVRQYFVIGHVGDSRSYLLTPKKPLRQLTKDHSLLQAQIDSAAIPQKQLKNGPLKNVLTRAVGVSPHLEVDIVSGQIHSGDIFLLCSDGLYNLVSDEEIEAVLIFDGPLSLKADMLVNMAIDAGGIDNVSVTLVEISTQ
jgi:protein phosphatase